MLTTSLGLIESRTEAVRALTTFLQAFSLADRGYTILIREFTGEVGVSFNRIDRVATITRNFFDDVNVAYGAVTTESLPQLRLPAPLLGTLGQKYRATFSVGRVGGAGAILDRAQDALSLYAGPQVGPPAPGPEPAPPTPADPQAWRQLYPQPPAYRGPGTLLRLVGVLAIVGVGVGGMYWLSKRQAA
jgi:uncharacterized protein YjeT (DUF2065 family)